MKGVGLAMVDRKDEAQEGLHRLDLGCGLYEHYKGGLYLVFAYSLSEDTLEVLVHYYSMDKGTRWTRTLANFEVVPPGEKDSRFRFVRRATPDEVRRAFGIVSF